MADDFLKFSTKGKKREEKKERKRAIMIKETVGKVISIHKS